LKYAVLIFAIISFGMLTGCQSVVDRSSVLIGGGGDGGGGGGGGC